VKLSSITSIIEPLNLPNRIKREIITNLIKRYASGQDEVAFQEELDRIWRRPDLSYSAAEHLEYKFTMSFECELRDS